MSAVTGEVVIVLGLLTGVAIAFIVDHFGSQRKSRGQVQVQVQVRPARIWSPQARENVRRHWRVAGRPALDRQPAVIDALAVLEAAEARLGDYYLTNRQPHEM